MDINFDKKIATIYNKTVKIDTLLNKLSSLSGEQVYGFFNNRGIKLPRKINCLAMTEVLNKRIKFLNSNSLSKDYFERLKYYSSFGETQLQQLFVKLCNEDDFQNYRINLFKLILNNFVALDLQDGEISYLRSLTTNKRKMGSFENYFLYITSSCLEQEDTFDGQNVDLLKKDLINTASSEDINNIAKKYGIDLPKNLTKDQFIAFILDYLSTKQVVSPTLEDKINRMTISELEEYAKDKNIPMQINLNKTNLINYLFYYLTLCELPITTINRINYSKEYEPLEFSIDFDKIPDFPTTEGVRVIHYDGEDNDQSEYEKMLAELALKEQKQKELEEALALQKEQSKKEKEELKRKNELLKQALAKKQGEMLKEESVSTNNQDSIINNKDSLNNDNSILDNDKDSLNNDNSILDNDKDYIKEDTNSLKEVKEISKDENEDDLKQEDNLNSDTEINESKDNDKESEKDNEPKKMSLLDEYIASITPKKEKEMFDAKNVVINDQYNSKRINNLVVEKSSYVIKVLIVLFLLIFIAVLIYILVK